MAQIKVNEKSNEITAIPELPDMLDIEGRTISTDAMGCQKDIASKIISKKADYILAIKDYRDLFPRHQAAIEGEKFCRHQPKCRFDTSVDGHVCDFTYQISQSKIALQMALIQSGYLP